MSVKILGRIDISEHLSSRKPVPIYKTGYYKEKQLVNDYGSGFGQEYIISVDDWENDYFQACEALGLNDIEYGDVWNQTRVYKAALTPEEAKIPGWTAFRYVHGWS